MGRLGSFPAPIPTPAPLRGGKVKVLRGWQVLSSPRGPAQCPAGRRGWRSGPGTGLVRVGAAELSHLAHWRAGASVRAGFRSSRSGLGKSWRAGMGGAPGASRRKAGRFLGSSEHVSSAEQASPLRAWGCDSW